MYHRWPYRHKDRQTDRYVRLISHRCTGLEWIWSHWGSGSGNYPPCRYTDQDCRCLDSQHTHYDLREQESHRHHIKSHTQNSSFCSINFDIRVTAIWDVWHALTDTLLRGSLPISRITLASETSRNVQTDCVLLTHRPVLTLVNICTHTSQTHLASHTCYVIVNHMKLCHLFGCFCDTVTDLRLQNHEWPFSDTQLLPSQISSLSL